MYDLEEGLNETLEETQSTARDLGGELASSLEDSGYAPDEQIKALVEAIFIVADGNDDLIDLAMNGLSK